MASSDKEKEDGHQQLLLKRIVRKPPTVYVRPPGTIPFHIPHRKLLEKYKKKEDETEPLEGFKESQKKRKKIVLSGEPPPPCEKKVVVVEKTGIERMVVDVEEPHKKVRKRLPPKIADQKELIKKMRSDKKIGFMYMVYAVPPSSEFYTPYSLKIVPYKDIDRTNFLTVSSHGVTQYTSDDMEFTNLDLWEEQYDKYCEVVKIKSFSNFRIWKAFYVWKKNVSWKKFRLARDVVNDELFMLNPVLGKALLDIQSACYKLEGMTFTDFKKIENLALFEFVEIQMTKIEEVEDRLREFRGLLVGVINGACHSALLKKGFTTDDLQYTQATPGQRKEKMSYAEQANKRRYCARLTCFILLTDYIVLHVLHTLVHRSLVDFNRILKMHIQYLPSDDKLSGDDITVKLEDTRQPNHPQLPMFIVDVIIWPSSLSLDPSEKVYLDAINQVLDIWNEKATNFNVFLSDSFFIPFCQPTIAGKQTERLCGYGPSLHLVLKQDPEIIELTDQTNKYFKNSFLAVETYIKRFEFIRSFYLENEEVDHETVKNERDLETFRHMLTLYHSQENDISRMVNTQPLGILYLFFQRFKDTALPSPQRLRNIVENVLPWIGKEKINSLIQESQEAQASLDIEPRTTEEYKEYLDFLEKSPEKVEVMEEEMDYCKELYDIIEEYEVPCPPEEMANYLGFSVTLSALHNLVDRKITERDKVITKFNTQINKDISALMEEVGKVRDEIMQPWLINIDSDAEKVKEALENYYEELQQCSERATLYREFQRAFKVEVTRFEMLDEVIEDVKNRQLLWNSVGEWKELTEKWMTGDFNTLNPDEMNQETAKYMKNAVQLEKKLPPNEIVPHFKKNVEIMKEKLPVIGDLRNQALRQRHWINIEGLLNYKFIPEETVTVELLENIGAFNYPAEIQEISGQASSEASLENLLRKVEEAWKSAEFIVLQHRDYKDVYVLGGIEEIQQIVDDSNININTIASSRHVGPIKHRVHEWIKQLDLFSQTLEEWLNCQQTWMYLESIFSAPDIQRQLPSEAKMFLVVDRSFKEIMRKTAKMPLALRACTAPGVLEAFQNNNSLLEQIMKCLEAYLESKRVVFPRFYFLSNDELLEILAQTRNPLAVQPHLRKCFDAIAKLQFGYYQEAEDEEVGQEESFVDTGAVSTTITAMISPEGERVGFGKGLKARGNVEEWLGKVEEFMFSSLKKRMQVAIDDYEVKSRNKWILSFPSQIVLTVSQIKWCEQIHGIFNQKEKNRYESLKLFENTSFEKLNDLAAMVRGDLKKLHRMVICSLITIDVHARDIVTSMVANKVISETNFEWLKQLRYYWDQELDNCVAKMSSACHVYGYEYLGASPRLVITPLTDKCYLCLMGALQLDLGGAPSGPAGTGKTETTKDLAKSLAIQCVVFNCSEGLDFKMMGRFFSGLAQSGAWCCFDEFNRIDIEVLSVIAQQLITIRNAKAAKVQRFMFEGREIKLVHSCAAFITMNPGYAGRTELPDNLKALFRPISMMVPDYALIAEVILYSEGFISSKVLANKMVQMYKLCSEQLSQQDHYDFGMRAVKSVLVMAGSLKRENPDISEDVVLIRALRDSNLPKFLTDDAYLFQGILNDLFPGVVIPEQEYGVLKDAIVSVMIQNTLQPEECMVKKVIQLHETMIVRHGVMLVGPTGGGKTTILNVLGDSLTKLYEDKVVGQYYRPVNTYILNPKSVTLGELYGEVNLFTMEWKDGLMGISVREAVQAGTEDHQWVICDGPVDAVWIENLNTVLDDNKMLCLANSERIKLTPYIHMVFEVQDLSQASPATVSRCGMVYVDPQELKWLPFVKTWLLKLKIDYLEEMKTYLLNLFETFVESGLEFINKKCVEGIKQVDISKVSTICALMESIFNMVTGIDWKADSPKLRNFVCQVFVFSYLWSVGGNVMEMYREAIELFIKTQFDDHPDARIPAGADLWNLYVNIQTKRFDTWATLMPTFKYDPNIPFFEMLVPTIDTVCSGYILERLIDINKPVLFTGMTGVGKSVIVKSVLNRLASTDTYIPLTLNFSAQTSSARTQEIIESSLEKRLRTVLGPPRGKKLVVFVDDVNMPRPDQYGSQPPIELLRQYLDFHGLYDREKLFWKTIEDVIIIAGCAPPGGGRNPLTPRFIRHFSILFIPQPTEISLKVIFKAIVHGFLQDFSQPIQDYGDSIVNTAVEIYQRIAVELLPTPAKSHYIFNLRDLSKCIQGVLQADAGTMRDPQEMLRLFYHECLRVFHDRLINIEDKSYFYHLMFEVCRRSFGDVVIPIPDTEIISQPPVLMFGDFMKMSVPRPDRIYEEIKDMEKLKTVLQDYLDDYNLLTPKEMKLIFFVDAMEHTTRIARILRSERGNALLVGVGGMGKQSLTRLASHLCGYKCYQIELVRGYDHNSFYEDLRKLYFNAGVNNEDTTFLFTDTQIVSEEFLEDINNILNSGEVPNLFEADEYEKVINSLRPIAVQAGIPEENREAIFDFFISRVRSKLHLVICMSPIGDDFRRRCRMFPSLVNCCTINWFTDWPEEALLSVAKNSLVLLGDETLVSNIANVCVLMHESVTKTTTRFFEEMRRHYYTTPSSYLELIKLYLEKIKLRKEKVTKKRNRIDNGLKKLYETNEMVDSMKEELIELKPMLQLKSADVAFLMTNLSKEQAEADKVRQVVVSDEIIVKAKAEETQMLADEAQRDLDAALPAMEAAMKALETLDKNDINELRVFNKPPNLVKFVMEAVCLLFGSKTDWQSAKLLLGDMNFLKKLQDYEKDKIPDSLLKKLAEYVDHPHFIPEKVAAQSKVCRSICMWVRAIDGYAKIYRVVQPKKKKLEQAERELNQVMATLREKQQKLAEVERQIAELEAAFEATMAEKNELEQNMETTANRIIRAGQLTTALSSEQIRWENSVKELDQDLACMVGDVLIASGSVAYLGAFTSNYRQELVDMWLKECKGLEIPSSETYSLVKVLADPFEIREWNVFGLPRDDVSTENAILVMHAGRWPLMIDPQEQANRWIKQMESKNKLQILKLTDSNFMRILEIAIREGQPVLLEDIGEFVDPVLAPVLLKQTFVQGGRTLIHLGDADIEYSSNFRFYLTTKLANPHYLPEVCIKVTIVNFTVTPSGLEDQLLSDVVRIERPDLEKQRNELITRINNDKTELESLEKEILELLFSSTGNILDNEVLIKKLNESKETSAIIEDRLEESEATEEKITSTRNKYRVVATRGSVLYFVVAKLADIDPMYQYSLKYFNQVFNTVIQQAPPSDDLETRLVTLCDEVTEAVYVNVSRGLFERHKLVYSFMLCIDILRNLREISEPEWNFLLRGPVSTRQSLLKRPDLPALTDPMWQAVSFLDDNFDSFKNIVEDVSLKIKVTIGGFVQIIDLSLSPKTPITNNWDDKLSDFEKLMLLKALQEEKLMFAITEFVKEKLGKTFVESPEVSLQNLYQDMSNITPLVFVLSTGSDPFGAFQRFASDMGFTDKILSISLGQGQGPVAEDYITRGVAQGYWVFLQNCHLATSWMLPMERIIQKLVESPEKIHIDFRLFLSSMPSKHFPVSVLQNSVKVTNEPPMGLKANVRRAFSEMTPDVFEDHPLEGDWRKMIFGICFFHGIIQERKKFGPLGWNITYEFTDSDRECALLTLKMFCTEQAIQWDALEYITGEITYGGRVTDYWDQRCLTTILSNFFAPHTLADGYVYSKSGIYYCPESPSFNTLDQYRDFIDRLPLMDEPEIFGMHENANIAFQWKETQSIVKTVLEVQPRESSAVKGASSDDIVYEIAEAVIHKLIYKISTEEIWPALMTVDDKGRLQSLSTVILQEVERYNKLLKVIHDSLLNLQKAIKGLVVMSEALEGVFIACLNNQVPGMWSAVAYPSLKSLGSWLKDLELRLDFISTWLHHGPPVSYWLSGFYFPQGFLTGTLQTHARKYDLPIDMLKFDFTVKKVELNQDEIYAAHIELQKEDVKLYKKLARPEDGVLVHGLFLDAARWDMKHMILQDAKPGELNPSLPVLFLLPTAEPQTREGRYVTPLYKTAVRAGVLSTTGHSTNFVLSVLLPTDKPENFWILRGTALLTMITD